MREIKSFASLTAGLLARKGAARPAMRPQDIGRSGFDPTPSAAAADDLGWNDMGETERDVASHRVIDVRLPASLSGAVERDASIPEVVRQQDEIAREFGGASDAPALATPGAPGRKTAFTLRLDAERHRRLRLACAIDGRSAQQMVTAAVDAMLAGRPDIDRLATQPASEKEDRA